LRIIAVGSRVITIAAESICITIIDQKICPLMPGIGKTPVRAINGDRRERSEQTDGCNKSKRGRGGEACLSGVGIWGS
jgi:hypothetical protein